MQSNQIRTLLVLTLLLAGGWGWLHFAATEPLTLQARDLEDQVRAESAKTLRLQQHIAYLVHQLDQNAERLTRENDD